MFRQANESAAPTHVSNTQLWEELRYIRSKVDDLQNKVLVLFGTVAAISIAVTIFEFLQNRAP